jgi:uncharacterized membrane-anchored protein
MTHHLPRAATVALVALTQLVVVGVAVAPQLSAHLTGETYVLRVAPLDPIDPFRGAYVTLDYPDLPRARQVAGGRDGDDATSGDVFVTLRPEDGVWIADDWTRERPGSGAYLACEHRDWQLRCGIDSWFLPQDEAAAMETALADGAYAEIRVDGRGHAVLVDVRESP